jgi:hypothetical protein
MGILPVPAFRRLRQEHHEFRLNLDYIVGPCVKTSKRSQVAHNYNPSYLGG